LPVADLFAHHRPVLTCTFGGIQGLIRPINNSGGHITFAESTHADTDGNRQGLAAGTAFKRVAGAGKFFAQMFGFFVGIRSEACDRTTTNSSPRFPSRWFFFPVP